MRQKLQLDLQTLDSFTMLIHGDRASGKTALAGDMLATELKAGGEVRFINVKGEDGTLTLRGMGLGDRGETVENYADFDACLNDYAKLGLIGLAVDSLAALNQWVAYKVCGAERMPVIDRNKPANEWGDLHREMNNLAMRLRRTAKYVICTCPSDKSTNQLTGKIYITPDLPGREAAGSAGWFDFVGYMRAEPSGPSKIRRTVDFRPNNEVIVRQRLPLGKAISDLITIPEGAGGWNVIKTEIMKRAT